MIRFEITSSARIMTPCGMEEFYASEFKDVCSSKRGNANVRDPEPGLFTY